MHAPSLLLNERLCVHDATLAQFGLYFIPLLGQQIDLRLKGLISRQSDFDAVFSWAQQHRSTHPTELMDVTRIDIVYKNGGPVGLDRDLDLSTFNWKSGFKIFPHRYVKHLFLPGQYVGYLNELKGSKKVLLRRDAYA